MSDRGSDDTDEHGTLSVRRRSDGRCAEEGGDGGGGVEGGVGAWSRCVKNGLCVESWRVGVAAETVVLRRGEGQGERQGDTVDGRGDRVEVDVTVDI